MDACEKILDDMETRCLVNFTMFDLILKETLEIIDEEFKFSEFTTSENKVRSLKDQYIYTSKYVDEFFNILSKYNYNMKQEIKDAITKLGSLKNPNKNSKIINKLINSPIIQDISFNGKNIFKITSRQYGNIKFQLANDYFRNDTRVKNYINNNELLNKCHKHAYYLSKLYPNYYSITALCPHYFQDFYHHSYTYDKDSNKIIDLCSNSVLDLNQYYKIFEPKNISIILNSEVEKELKITEENTNQYFDLYELLKIALYKQYLNRIGYTGELENAPKTKSLKR